MPTAQAKYRIDKITIEGFRGFTRAQTIAFNGRNAFVFGVNGRGKSSIIEAIRWVLFGSKAGQDIEVRNTFYHDIGECSVTLQLTSGEGPLELKRELRPGSNLSRLTVRDAKGDVVAEKQVLPQLARIGQQEGTEVIFAAQHATGRQAQVDITNFTKVLCFYLRLEKVPQLIEDLDTLLQERAVQHTELSKELESAESKIRYEIRQTQTALDVILKNPPWGEGPAPTGAETQSKIITLFTDASRAKGTSPRNEKHTLGEALNALKAEIEQCAGRTAAELQARLTAALSQQQNADAALSDFSRSVSSRDAVTKELAIAQQQLEHTLGGDTVEGISAQTASLEKSLTFSAVVCDVAIQAKKLSEQYGSRFCPACGIDHETDSALGLRIDANIHSHATNPQDQSKLESLRGQLKQIESLTVLIGTRKEALKSINDKVDKVATLLSCLLPGIQTPPTQDEIKARLCELQREIESLTLQLQDGAGDRAQWMKRIRDLEQELAFHKYRDKIEKLGRKLRDGLAGARDVLRQYQDLINSVQFIHKTIRKAFDEALNRAVPELERMLTEVYRRLTRHPSFDIVKIVPTAEQPMRRELRVASTKSPGNTFPPSVLNGQAAKALRLVPYFVFSKFQPDVMELDLLLIDDPSESFDTSHVSELVAELSLAAQHAQLFVATHEREKFEPLLPGCFTAELPAQVSVEGFDTTEGPQLVCR